MASSPQPDLGRRMMNQALAVLAMVGVIVYFIYSGNVELDEPVVFEVTATQSTAAGTANVIPITLALRLTNMSKEGAALTVPSQCNTFNWFLTGLDNEFVQSMADEGECKKQTVSTWLDTNKAMEETHVLALDPKRVHPGEYRLHVRYWGHETTKDITIK